MSFLPSVFPCTVNLLGRRNWVHIKPIVTLRYQNLYRFYCSMDLYKYIYIYMTYTEGNWKTEIKTLNIAEICDYLVFEYVIKLYKFIATLYHGFGIDVLLSPNEGVRNKFFREGPSYIFLCNIIYTGWTSLFRQLYSNHSGRHCLYCTVYCGTFEVYFCWPGDLLIRVFSRGEDLRCPDEC